MRLVGWHSCDELNCANQSFIDECTKQMPASTFDSGFDVMRPKALCFGFSERRHKADGGPACDAVHQHAAEIVHMFRDVGGGEFGDMVGKMCHESAITYLHEAFEVLKIVSPKRMYLRQSPGLSS